MNILEKIFATERIWFGRPFAALFFYEEVPGEIPAPASWWSATPRLSRLSEWEYRQLRSRLAGILARRPKP